MLLPVVLSMIGGHGFDLSAGFDEDGFAWGTGFSSSGRGRILLVEDDEDDQLIDDDGQVLDSRRGH